MKVRRLTGAVLIAAACGAFALAGPSEAGAVTQQVTDGGFEAGSPAWTYTNSQRCNSSCGLAAAHGNFYGSIGPLSGAQAPPGATVDVGEISQTVTIPEMPGFLELELRRVDRGPATFNTEFEVFYDGTLVQSKDHTSAGKFVKLAVGVSTGTYGVPHQLELKVRCLNAGGTATIRCDRYDVDDVSLESGPRPPNTFITTTPLETTHDPTPTFEFSASPTDSTFQCKVDGGAFYACTSPETVEHLPDGSHTFAVRAHNAAGFDPTPATDTFKLTTASVSRSGSTLTVTAAAGAEDNIAIRRPSASTIRITDSPGGAYEGSGVHVGAGCMRVGDYAADCSASGISLVNVKTRDQSDRVTNVTHLRSQLIGGAAADLLLGGSVNDTITGGPGADTMRGMNGNDTLLGRDLTDDAAINCDGDTVPGLADHADLDTLPKDSPASGCESVTRH